MEKLGVVLDDEKTKTAGQKLKCPKCGSDLPRQKYCNKCGTEPFEKRPVPDEKWIQDHLDAEEDDYDPRG
jgi:hypothetical protein